MAGAMEEAVAAEPTVEEAVAASTAVARTAVAVTMAADIRVLVLAVRTAAAVRTAECAVAARPQAAVLANPEVGLGKVAAVQPGILLLGGKALAGKGGPQGGPERRTRPEGPGILQQVEALETSHPMK